MTVCERIGHQFRDGVCRDCGLPLAETPLAVGTPVYDPRRLPVGAVIASGECGPVKVRGIDGDNLLTTDCRCGESKIRLESAAWRCGGVVLESLPPVLS